MILSADLLSTLQRCPRRYMIEQEYSTVRWPPKSMLEVALRRAIAQISTGADVMITSQGACTWLLEKAAREGLDTLHDPYTLARDYCAILHTVLEALSRLSLLAVKAGPVVQLGETEHCWKINAFQDESGLLHRWAFVTRWDEDTKWRELHSWQCFGDCAAGQVGMMLHVVEIGQQHNGHQHTDWARSYKHPAIHNHYKFRKVDGGKLEASWIPVWYQSSDKNDPKTWVDLMQQDGVNLIHHINIAEPAKEHVQDFYAEIDQEAERISVLGAWNTVPRSRPACDFPTPCQWQAACYSRPQVIDIASIGGYTRAV